MNKYLAAGVLALWASSLGAVYYFSHRETMKSIVIDQLDNYKETRKRIDESKATAPTNSDDAREFLRLRQERKKNK